MSVNAAGVTAPAMAIVTTIPPATAPSIYFAGTPSMVVTTNSSTYYGDPICNEPGTIAYMGAIQNVPVNSLGLTPPFHLQ